MTISQQRLPLLLSVIQSISRWVRTSQIRPFRTVLIIVQTLTRQKLFLPIKRRLSDLRQPATYSVRCILVCIGGRNSNKTIEGVSFEAYTLYRYRLMIRLFLFVFTLFLYPCLYYFRNNHKLVEACHNTINKACNTVSYFSIHKVGFEETPERTEE